MRVFRAATLMLLGLTSAVAGGCSSSAVRFEPGPVVLAVDDRRDVDRPAEREFHRYEHHIQNFFDRRMKLGLDPVPSHPALDVNRRGQVPGSSWYEPRTAALTPDEVYEGHGAGRDGPEHHFPWTITGGKVGGANPGFVIEDASGERFLLKFDKRHTPTIATAAGAVANRLFWALGYHVPDDRVVFFERGQVRLGDGARKDGITDEAVDQVLAAVATSAGEGRWRALVSRFLPGRPVGGFSYTGTRDDDPNDRIPHERRRSLRGLRVFAAWLNHVDAKIDNTLDLYTERDGRRFLEHFLVDFDGCLGGYWAARHEPRVGWAYDLDLGQLLTAIPQLGLDERPYDRLEGPVHPEIGLFEAEVYDPAQWKANYVNNQLLSARPADLYWAGEVMAQLSREHIAAAVRAARFSDPEATTLLTEILHGRWRSTTSWALGQVTPVTDLDRLEAGEGGWHLPARDALVKAGLDSNLHYSARLLDEEGREIAELMTLMPDPGVFLPADHVAGRDYVVLEWTARRSGGAELPVTEAHYRRVADAWQLLGILRDGQ